MCMGHNFGQPYGIPIPEETHELFPEAVKRAYEIFDGWMRNATEESGGEPISRRDMPEEVRAAMNMINEAVIPGYEEEGTTGADSCYMIMASEMLTD